MKRRSSQVSFPFPFIVIGVLFYFMLIKPERRKQKSHRDLLTNVKKSDRVVTVGGIKGVVSNVNKETEEVTLTVDESTGTKIRITLSSIARLDKSDSKKE
ncbi:MAG: preprotein translocase subunit YajC [Pirellulales bacterium]